MVRRAPEPVLIILVTAANQTEAVRLGEQMVKAKLAACVNVVPTIQSIYEWKGKVIKAKEVLLILKSTRRRYKALEKAIRAIHTYETPEIIALQVTKGLDQYLGWVRRETHN